MYFKYFLRGLFPLPSNPSLTVRSPSHQILFARSIPLPSNSSCAVRSLSPQTTFCAVRVPSPQYFLCGLFPLPSYNFLRGPFSIPPSAFCELHIPSSPHIIFVRSVPLPPNYYVCVVRAPSPQYFCSVCSLFPLLSLPPTFLCGHDVFALVLCSCCARVRAVLVLCS